MRVVQNIKYMQINACWGKQISLSWKPSLLKNFILGENKKVRVQITSSLGEDFEITNASYKLVNGSSSESTGNCTIEPGHIISTQVQPKNAGSYTLALTYTIGGETLKTNIGLIVAQ